jgi:hypothetical protein
LIFSVNSLLKQQNTQFPAMQAVISLEKFWLWRGHSQKTNMFVENDQSTLWNYCMICIANCIMQCSEKCILRIFMGNFNTEYNVSGKSSGKNNIKSFETKKLISRRIFLRMLATEIVFILILRHGPCKCSATIIIGLGSRKWFFLKKWTFKVYYDHFQQTCDLFCKVFFLMAPCFYVTLETYSNVLIIFDRSEFLELKMKY